MDQRREDRSERAGRRGGPGERNGKLTDFTGKKTGRRELTFPMSYKVSVLQTTFMVSTTTALSPVRT